MNINTKRDIVFNKVIDLLNNECPVNFGINLKYNQLASSNKHKKTWKKVAKNIIHILEDKNISYVLMKTFDVPYIYMEDVDILIENDEDILKTMKILRNENYLLYRDRYSFNHLKITALPYHNRGIQVDIYPDSVWFNMRYAPKKYITSNRIKRKILGIDAYFPSPTIEAYVIATHSYNHGRYTLAEVAYMVRLIEEHQLDWLTLSSLSNKYRLNHSVFLIFKLASFAIISEERNNDINKFLKDLFVDDPLSKLYFKWFIQKKSIEFPMRIPMHLRLIAAFVRLFRPSLKASTRVFDELIGYLLALFSRGNRRVLIT